MAMNKGMLAVVQSASSLTPDADELAFYVPLVSRHKLLMQNEQVAKDSLDFARTYSLVAVPITELLTVCVGGDASFARAYDLSTDDLANADEEFASIPTKISAKLAPVVASFESVWEESTRGFNVDAELALLYLSVKLHRALYLALADWKDFLVENPNSALAQDMTSLSSKMYQQIYGLEELGSKAESTDQDYQEFGEPMASAMPSQLPTLDQLRASLIVLQHALLAPGIPTESATEQPGYLIQYVAGQHATVLSPRLTSAQASQHRSGSTMI